MEFKFKAKLFKNDPSQNKNNNPKYPKYGGTIEMPLSKLEAFVEYMHWAAKTELKFDDFLKEHVVPVKISGWNGKSETTGKQWVDLYFEPGYKALQAAIEAKEAAQLADSQEIQAHQASLDKAAASLAQGTAGTVMKPDQEDIF